MPQSLSQRRLGLLFLVFGFLIALAAGRATWLSVVRADDLRAAAATQQRTEAAVPAPRGTVVDRRGVELAVSQPAADVTATPYLVKDPTAAANAIGRILGQDTDVILRKLTAKDSGFAYLARQIPVGRAERITRRMAEMKVDGVDVTPTTSRSYPRDWLGAQVLGTVGTDGNGLSGLEQQYERQLHGRDGKRSVLRDARGQPINIRDPKPARPGAAVQLTIDAGLQARVEDVLGEVGKTFRPKGATAVVMEPNTGNVLALGNWPRINANDVGGAPPYARMNRAVGFTYEPGSTLKPFTVAAALEEREVKADTPFTLPPTIQVADRVIKESHPRGTVTLDTAGILAQSSNVGTVMIGQRLGERRFDEWVRRFGFGRTSAIDLPGEERGIVPARADYSGSSIGNLPIGQGISVTPMQLATAYAALANGGVLRTPRIVSRIGGRPVAQRPGRRVVSEATARDVRGMLKGVLAAGGTASEVAIPGYSLAGKTGTAEKVDPQTGTYSKSRYIASFAGFAPAERPQLLITVMVDEPGGGSIYGGEVAAPAFEKIARFALPYLRIAPR